LRDRLATTFSAPWRSLSGAFRNPKSEIRNPKSETIWALKDVSFEVKRGEVVGIIGRNGAGKSTLLKILSRITEPTEGYAEVHGRVGSLLEVGTGFHPELTGGENIYLNGAILGMKRAEIEAKFDEIVAFAEVEKFIDTPVKHYSSGMYLRLAFAVAAHLDPEILLVDEVLAVGDAQFQKKCLGKMGGVAQQGRTVLFVSHNMAALCNLCSKALLLDQGHAREYQGSAEVVDRYMRILDVTSRSLVHDRSDRSGSGKVRFTKVSCTDQRSGGRPTSVRSGLPMCIRVGYKANNGKPVNNLVVDMRIVDAMGNFLLTCSTRFTHVVLRQLPPVGELQCIIPKVPLLPGRYFLDLWGAVAGEEADHVKAAAQFEVQPGDFFGTAQLPVAIKHGPFLVDHFWAIGELPAVQHHQSTARDENAH
jgi:lipopolysaccharide transport system ATP-binding protein